MLRIVTHNRASVRTKRHEKRREAMNTRLTPG
jgi:hypothetical protein